MKKQAYTLVALLVLVGGMAVAAQAQKGNYTELMATIPFEFNVGEKRMPAGDYVVRHVNPTSSLVVLQLRSSDGKYAAMIQMNPIARSLSNAAMLNFNRYGSQYFLAQAWMPGSDGLAAMKSKGERGLRREKKVIRQTETVALRTR